MSLRRGRRRGGGPSPSLTSTLVQGGGGGVVEWIVAQEGRVMATARQTEENQGEEGTLWLGRWGGGLARGGMGDGQVGTAAATPLLPVGTWKQRDGSGRFMCGGGGGGEPLTTVTQPAGRPPVKIRAGHPSCRQEGWPRSCGGGGGEPAPSRSRRAGRGRGSPEAASGAARGAVAEPSPRRSIPWHPTLPEMSGPRCEEGR